MPIDVEQAGGLIEKLGPKVLKIAGFGDADRAALLENAVWAVGQVAEIAARAEALDARATSQEQVAQKILEETAAQGQWAKSIVAELDAQGKAIRVQADALEAIRRKLDALLQAVASERKKGSDRKGA